MEEPRTGEIWEHFDGGSIYVLATRGVFHLWVKIQRRPFGDSLAKPKWVKQRTFDAMAVSKLR